MSRDTIPSLNMELLRAKDEAYARACSLMAYFIDTFDASVETKATQEVTDKRWVLIEHAVRGSKEWMTLIQTAKHLDLVCAARADAYIEASNEYDGCQMALIQNEVSEWVDHLVHRNNEAASQMRLAALAFFAEASIETNAYSRRKVASAWPLTEFGEIPHP